MLLLALLAVAALVVGVGSMWEAGGDRSVSGCVPPEVAPDEARSVAGCAVPAPPVVGVYEARTPLALLATAPRPLVEDPPQDEGVLCGPDVTTAGPFQFCLPEPEAGVLPGPSPGPSRDWLPPGYSPSPTSTPLIPAPEGLLPSLAEPTPSFTPLIPLPGTAFGPVQDFDEEATEAEAEPSGDEADPPGIDESARPFLDSEKRLAELLAAEGRTVVSVPEGQQPSPDALVDGEPTEFKSLVPGAKDSTVKNRLNEGKKQAPTVLIDARGSGLALPDAQRGVARVMRVSASSFKAIRIVGDGFDYRYPES